MTNKLTKKVLYMLYVEEKKSDAEIAKKTGKYEHEIRNLRKEWNININQRFLADFTEIDKLYKKFKYTCEMQEVLQEYVGIPKFYDLYMPILEKLKDQETHKIEEFWDLANIGYNVVEKEKAICGNQDNLTLYYRVNWCIYKMLKDKLIQKNEKEYRISNKGIEEYNKQNNVEKIKLKEIHPKEHYKKIVEITENPRIRKHRKTSANSSKTKIPRKIDFEKINKSKKDLGDFCEEMVLLKEKERIVNEGRADLLDEIIWTSKEVGDGTGYDIESLRKNGENYEKIYIEVKGSNSSKVDNFIVTINELRASWELKDKYYICQVTDAKKENPKMKFTQGEIDKNFKLDAIQFEASAIEE